MPFSLNNVFSPFIRPVIPLGALTCALLTGPSVFSEDIPFDSIDGTICLKASVDGNPTETFILDTGATVTVLTPAAARAMNLATIPGKSGYDTAILRSISVGGAVVRNVPVHVFDPPQARSLRTKDHVNYKGLLGYSFLSHFAITIDYRKQILRLSEKKDAAPLPPGKIIPGACTVSLQVQNETLLVKARINEGSPLSLMLDTGSCETTLFPDAAKRGKIMVHSLAKDPKTLYSIGNVTVGNARVKQMPFLIDLPLQSQFMDVAHDGILGTSFLTNFLVTIDYPGKCLHLAPHTGNPREAETRTKP